MDKEEIYNAMVKVKEEPAYERCKYCKHFKCYYSTMSSKLLPSCTSPLIIKCKKGNKEIAREEPFACGQFKPKRRKR